MLPRLTTFGLCFLILPISLAIVNGTPPQQSEKELLGQLQELKIRRSELLDRLGVAHPMVASVNKRIEAIEAMVASDDNTSIKLFDELQGVHDQPTRAILTKILLRMKRLEDRIEELEAKRR